MLTTKQRIIRNSSFYLKEEGEIQADEKIDNTIIEMITSNEEINDSIVHATSERLGIDTHIFEGYIYNLLKSFIKAGKSIEKNFKEEAADPKQLEIGIEVEMEHTTNRIISKKIALDHLSEQADYYSKLVESGIVDEQEAIDVYNKYYKK